MEFLSIYAAVVSTLVGGWAIYGIWRDRDSLAIDVRFGYILGTPTQPFMKMTPTRDSNFEDNNTLITLTARNTGRRLIRLTAGGFYYRNDHRTSFTGKGAGQYPIDLPEGHAGETHAKLLILNKSFQEYGSLRRAYFESEAGRRYYAKIPKAIVEAIEGG